jgi:mRNA-degrading endonuclease toxin of MazEF toxin-antitoxin module
LSIPDPKPGLVFRYEYLWKDRGLAAQESAEKDRPACVVLAIQWKDEDVRVLIAPITRTAPADYSGIEIPTRVKLHLGLDGSRSWIVTSEANIDIWPSPDMRGIPGKPGQFEYGLLPAKLTERVREAIRNRIAGRTLRTQNFT